MSEFNLEKQDNLANSLISESSSVSAIANAWSDQPLLGDILIVDDKVENLRLLSNMLTKQGYTVRKATSGQMALKAIACLPPDLILLDVMMPDMKGYEVCQILKENPATAAIPIVFLSALDDVLDKVQAFHVGAVDYITKPFQFEEVLVRVHTQLALRAAQQEIRQLNVQLEARVKERTQQLQAVNQRLQETALYDPLTGSASRIALVNQIEQRLQQAKTDSTYQFAVLTLDCDRFKIVNDSLGHEVGDRLLQEMTQLLRQMVRPDDELARLGGDEFAILLNGIDSPDLPIQVAEQILARLKQPFHVNGSEIFVNISIGIVTSGPDYAQSEHLLRDADTAMYRAKASGQGRYQVFTAAMHQAAHRSFALETDLHRAVNQQEFRVYYQPIVDLRTGQIVGFEALVRWLHPQQGLILPDSFLPTAIETGLICPIGNWVMRQACQQVAQWQDQSESPLMIYINLSAHQLNQPHLLTDLDQILTQTQLNPALIKLEITESSMLQSLQCPTSVLTQLQNRGIQLSLDDFGTGYSSLGQLRSSPVSTLKIDRAFVQQLDGSIENLGLVPVILSLAQVMQMDVVAEGIETPQQLAQLRELGCHLGQGFLFSEPVEAEQAIALMSQTLT